MPRRRLYVGGRVVYHRRGEAARRQGLQGRRQPGAEIPNPSRIKVPISFWVALGTLKVIRFPHRT